MKEFLNESFCRLLLIIHIVLMIVNRYGFFKVCKFCQILHFILKIYHNFESYQKLLTILAFFFLYDKLQPFFYFMHITPHLHMVKYY